MTNAAVRMLVAVWAMLTLAIAGGAWAGTPCQDCQNDCLAPIVECKKKHSEQHCFDKFGAAYGACKVECKGKPVCTDGCRHIHSTAKKGQKWHGAECYSSGGCNCSALRCKKEPHVRQAQCFSEPG